MANSNSTQKSWGGQWTEDKLDCFEKYVKAYLTIMNKHRDKNKWQLFYFEGFAGSGDREKDIDTAIEENNHTVTQLSLFDEIPSVVQERPQYRGAAERVVLMEQKTRGFDYYYFIEKSETNLTRLEFKLNKYETVGRKVFRPGDANSEVLNMAGYMRSHPEAKVLCLLDPYGMSVKWSTITALAGTGVDLWILVPTGMIVSRLIQNNGQLRYPQKLEEFFGLPAKVIHDTFYIHPTYQPMLFDGESGMIQKRKNIINEIINLYCEQLGSLFSFVTHDPLVMRNGNGLPIFHFVCASDNKAAIKIAQSICNMIQQKKTQTSI